jgi:hypothetical protein
VKSKNHLKKDFNYTFFDTILALRSAVVRVRDTTHASANAALVSPVRAYTESLPVDTGRGMGREGRSLIP